MWSSVTLYKSINGGDTWNKIHDGFPAGDLGRIAVAVAPSDGNILYAVLETEDKSKNGLWKSKNAGQTWEHLNNDFGLVVRPFYFSRITVNPKDPNIVVKGGLYGSISKDEAEAAHKAKREKRKAMKEKRKEKREERKAAE